MNQGKDKKFDEAIRKNLDAIRPEVSAAIWGKIEEDLGKEKVKRISSIQKISRVRWGAAAVVLILTAAAILNYTWKDEVLYLRGTDEPIEMTSSKSSRPIRFEPLSDPFMDQSDLNISATKENGRSDKLSEGTKLSQDISTISRVLAQTLARTERRAENTLTQLAHTSDEEFTQELPAESLLIASTDLLAAESLASQAATPFPVETVRPVIQPNIHTEPQPNMQSSTIAMQDAPLVPSEDPRPAPSYFGVSRLLNLVVAQVDKRSEKFVSFSHDEEGSLMIDVNLALNKKQ